MDNNKMRREILLGRTIENLGDYFINKHEAQWNNRIPIVNYLVFKGSNVPPWALKARHTTLKSARAEIKNLQSKS